MRHFAFLFVLSSITITLSTSIAQQADKDYTLNEMCGISIKAQALSFEIFTQRNDALGELPYAEKTLRDIQFELSKKQADPKRIAEAERDVQRETEQLARMDEDHYSPENIARARHDLKWAKRMLAATKLQGAAERQAEKDKAKAEYKKVEQEIAEVGKPFEERRGRIRDQITPLRPKMIDALRPYAKTPSEPFAGKLTRVTMSPNLQVGGYVWEDAQGNELAWAKVHIQKKGRVGSNLLDGKYPIERASSRGVYVYAGELMVSFGSKNKQLAKKEVLLEQIQNFVDLEGLSKIVPDQEAAMPGPDQAP
jgi:hypothetical protein